jgi:thiol:disulfide interchange protein
MNFRKISVIVLILVMVCGTMLAEDNKHFSTKAQPSKLNIKAGEKFTIMYTVIFDKGWHTYSMKEQLNSEGIGPIPTEISIDPKEILSLDNKIIAPKPKKKYDTGFNMDVETLGGKLQFKLPVKALKNISFDKQKISVVFYLQQCTDEKCLPPMEFKTPVSNEVFAEDLKVDTTQVAEVSSQKSEVSNQKSEVSSQKSEDVNQKTVISSNQQINESTNKQGAGGLLALILTAISMGAVSLLAPCVYPMVPITVSFFTNRASKTKGKGLRDAVAYALGIIITFTAVGFIFSLLFGATGIQLIAKNPWVYMFISVLFIVFALSLLGAFELQLPTSLMNKLDAKSRAGSGISSVILMALTFSLASFSCTGPFIAATLVAASQGQWFNPIISMLIYSTVLSAPFFILALIPSFLTSLPRAGGWMNNVKVVMGFITLATTLYFLNNAFAQWEIALLSREIFLAIWIGISFLITLYILGVFKTAHDAPVNNLSTARIIIALAFATFTFYLLSGLFGKPLGELETFVPQGDASTSLSMTSLNSSPEAEVWLTDYNQALAEAKKQNKSIFIDFTGKSCTNCKKMEKTIFPNQKVREAFAKMVKVKMVTDINKEPYISNQKFQQNKFQKIDLPFYAIMSSDDNVIATTSFTSSLDEFVKFLEKGIK